MNDNIPTLLTILERIAAGAYTDADLADLRRALLASGQGNVVQIGRYNVVIHNGQDIRIGDTIYQLPPPEPETDLVAAEARYRSDVVQQYDRLDLSGVLNADFRKSDEPDHKLSRVALQDIFVHLSLTVRKVIVQRDDKQNQNVQHGEKQNENVEKRAKERKERPPQSGRLSRRHQTDKKSRLREKLAEDIRSKDAATRMARLSTRQIKPGASSSHGDAEKESRPQQERIVEVKQPITLAEALSQDALIIGEPGAGKSTLLRWLAVTYAQGLQRETDRLGMMADRDRVPVYITLGQLPRHYLEADERQAPDWRSLLPTYVARQPGMATGAEVLIRQALTDGRCLLLFDGLDEIVDRQARARVARSIAQQFGDGNRVVVGSRPGGLVEVEGALLPRFRRCQIERFTEEQILQFFRFWYSQDGNLSEEIAQAQAMELFGDLQKRPEALKLAQTPLLATIILLIWRSEGRLPRRRTKLYERCCKVLIESWESNHDVAYAGVLKDLGWEKHLRLLAPLAFMIHVQGQRTSAPGSELLDVLAHGLQTEGLCKDVGRARFEAEQFLRTFGVRSGLLQHLGGGEYSFPHLTFQEYLTARYIAEQTYPDYIDLLMAHLHEAWWSDVHVLTIGCLGNGQKDANRLSPLLLAILRLYPPPSRCLQPDFLFDLGRRLPRLQLLRRVCWLLGRELELTARGIWEASPESISSEVNEAFDTLAWGYIARHLELDPSDRSSQEGRRVSATLSKVSPRLVQQLADSLGSSTWMVRVNAAEILLDLGTVTNIAVERRVKALAYTDGQNGRRTAREQLDELDLQHPIVVKTLVAVLNTPHEDNWRERWCAAELLGRTGRCGEEAVPALCAALRENGFDSWIRSIAAISLGQLGYAKREAVDALVSTLEDKVAGCEAALSLIRLGVVAPTSPLEDKVIAALRSSTQNTVVGLSSPQISSYLIGLGTRVLAPLIELLASGDDLQRAAAVALVQLGQSDSKVGIALVEATKHPHWMVRANSARILGELGQTSPEALNALVRALQNDAYLAPDVAATAAKSLGLLGQATPEVMDGLLGGLRHFLGKIQQACSASIGYLGRTDSNAIPELLRAVQRSYSSFFLDRIVEALNGSGIACPQPVDGLIRAFDDDDQELRWLAARLLGKLAQANPTALPPVIQSTRSESTLQRMLAVFALGISGTSDMDAIQALSSALNDSDNAVRLQAAESLCQLGYGNTQVIQVLKDLLDTSDVGWCSEAAQALIQWRLADSKVVEVLLAQLSSGDTEARRCSAVILGELDEPVPVVLSALLTALNDDQSSVRMAGARSLGQLMAASPEIIQGLKAALGDWDRDVRSAAAKSLGQIRPLTQESVRALETALNDRDWDVRLIAARSLAGYLETDPLAEGALRKAVTDKEEWVQEMAARTLGEAMEAAPDIVAALVEALNSQTLGVAVSATRTLEALGKITPTVTEMLAGALLDGSLKPPEMALKLLGDIGNPTPKAIRALVQACSNEDPGARNRAAISLGQLGYADEEVIEALSALLREDHHFVRESAIESLSKLNLGSSELLQPLLGNLHSDEWSVRSETLRLLNAVRSVESEAKDPLMETLQSPSAWTREVGARLLGRLKPSSQDIIEALAEVLADEEANVRNAAADSLGELSQTDPQAAEQLVQALHGAEDTHQAARKNLEKWAPLNSLIVEALVNDLDHGGSLDARLSPGVVQLQHAATTAANAWGTLTRRRDAASVQTALRSLVEVGRALPPALWDLLVYARPEGGPGASWYALRNLRPSSSAVRTVLLQAFEHRSPVVRSAAALALDASEENRTPQLAHELTEALTSQCRDIRLAAATALSQSKHLDNPEAVRALIKALSDENQEIRCLSAIALAQTGYTDLSVIRNLLASLDDQDSALRQKALETLKMVYPGHELRLVQILALLVKRLHARYLSSDDSTCGLISQLLNGRPLPGYRWVPIRERQNRRRRRLHVAIAVGVVAAILLVAPLWTAAQELLGTDSRTVTFVAAAAGVVGLLAAVAEMLGYLRGRKNQE